MPLRVLSADEDIFVPLTLQAHAADARWEELAQNLSDAELRRRVTPPHDAELLRFHPTVPFVVHPYFALDGQGPWVNDITRLGFSVADLLGNQLAWQNSLWVFSYFADPDGRQLLSRNYLRASSSWAYLLPTTADPVSRAELDFRRQYPGLEHTVVYAPAQTITCWLQLRLALARGGRQVTFTTATSGTQPGLVELRLSPDQDGYQLASGLTQVRLQELIPVRARRPEAPTLNQEPTPQPRYETTPGQGFQPVTAHPDFTVE